MQRVTPNPVPFVSSPVAQDPSAIEARLRSLLEKPELARQMGAQGRAKVQARFAWPAIATAYLELYQELGVRPRS